MEKLNDPVPPGVVFRGLLELVAKVALVGTVVWLVWKVW